MSIFSAAVWCSACCLHHTGETGTQPALSNQKVLLALGKGERIATVSDCFQLTLHLSLSSSHCSSVPPWAAALQASLSITKEN